MKKHANLTLLSCAAVLLLSGPALANHCAADLTKVQQRLSQPTSASTNALEAAVGIGAGCGYGLPTTRKQKSLRPLLTRPFASRATSRWAGPCC